MTFKEFIDKITEFYLYPNLYVLLFKIANEEEIDREDETINTGLEILYNLQIIHINVIDNEYKISINPDIYKKEEVVVLKETPKKEYIDKLIEIFKTRSFYNGKTFKDLNSKIKYINSLEVVDKHIKYWIKKGYSFEEIVETCYLYYKGDRENNCYTIANFLDPKHKMQMFLQYNEDYRTNVTNPIIDEDIL